MGKDNDLFVSIKSGHVLYCFFPFESIRSKNRKIKLTEKIDSLQYRRVNKVLFNLFLKQN